MSDNRISTRPNEIGSDRGDILTLGFDTIRKELVGGVNGFLERLRCNQANGQPTTLGSLGILPLLTQTDVANNGSDTYVRVKEYTPGAVLYQQNANENGPYTLEAIARNNNEIEIIYVTGTSVAERHLRELGGGGLGGYREPGFGHIDASFGVYGMGADSPIYYKYDIWTDGTVIKHFMSTSETATSVPVRTTEDLGMARLALVQIQERILVN